MTLRTSLNHPSRTKLSAMAIVAIVAVMAAGAAGSASANCVVIGSPDAVVFDGAQKSSPAFTARDCTPIRLVSGKATALWTTRDGRAGGAPLTATDAPRGYPGPSGSQTVDRFGDALAALTGKGVQMRAGFKRFDDADNGAIADVWVGPAGLSVPMSDTGPVRLVGLRGGQGQQIGQLQANAGRVLVIPATAIRGFEQVRLDLPAGKRLTLRRLAPAEQEEVDRSVAQVDQIAGLAPADRSVARALVFETNGLPLNRDAELLSRQ